MRFVNHLTSKVGTTFQFGWCFPLAVSGIHCETRPRIPFSSCELCGVSVAPVLTVPVDGERVLEVAVTDASTAAVDRDKITFACHP